VFPHYGVMADVRINEYRLLRAREGRMLAGVAAGLAQSSGLDVTIVRLCLGAMMLSGFGVAAYIVMWIILPEESPRRGLIIEPAPEQTAKIMRIALVGLGALSALNTFGGFLSFANPRAHRLGLDGGIGLVLLGIGIAVLFTRHRPDRPLWEAPSTPSRSAMASAGDEDDEPRTFTGPFADVVETVHGALSDTFSEMRTTVQESKARSDAMGSPVADDYDVDDTDDTDWNDYSGYYDDETYDEPEGLRTPVVTVTGGTDRSGGAALVFARIAGWLLLIWWVLGSLAIVGGWAIGVVTVRSPILLSVVSGFVFIGVLRVLLHAKFARAIVPALALLLIPVAIAASTVRVKGVIGETFFTPEMAAHIPSHGYRQAVGRMTVDLSAIHSAKPVTVNSRLGIGQMIVIVPNNATVKVNTRTDLGSYELFGRESHGASPRENVTYEGCEGGPKFTLNLRTDVGETMVRYVNGARAATC
jgi:phage shock protein PspC (stress-responsive transcriptional regulator)